MSQRWNDSDLADRMAQNSGLKIIGPQRKRVAVKSAKVPKYRARPTEVDGVVFASKKEAARFQELRLLEKAGEISNLETQVKFSLDIEGYHICNWTADFAYDTKEGEVIIEDVKSKATRTPVYGLKRRLMLALYRISIKET